MGTEEKEKTRLLLRVQQLQQALREKDVQIGRLKGDIQILKETASALSAVRDQLRGDLSVKEAEIEGRDSIASSSKETPTPRHMRSLRVTADGIAIVHPRGDYIAYKLAEIPDPFSFFSRLFDGYICYMNIDLTDNCNLRCPFCFNDFTKATRTRMTEDVFDKVLSLLPMVPEQCFYVSCAFEPFLHPRFTELLKRIPANQKSKGFFTTNLTIPLQAKAFEDLSVSNLNFINISLDSLDQGTFEQLRVRGKFTIFKKQVETLASVFRNAADPPKLRYITMACKQNLDEISTLVQVTHKDYLAHEHEIRLPFDFSGLDPAWKAKSWLTIDEWNRLEKAISQLGHRVKFLNQCYQPFYGRVYNE